MARNVALSELRDRVRWETDTENATRRFPSASVDKWINEGIAQFHAELVRARGQGFAEASTTITTVNGTRSYALPAALLEVVKVWTVVNGFDRILHTYEEWDTDGILNPSTGDDGYRWVYRIVGDNIDIQPTPTLAKVVNIKYIATAVKLLSDASTVDGIDGLEEFIVAWAGVRIAIKNRDWELKAALDSEAAAVLDRLRALQPARNAAEPPRMQDVRPYAGLYGHGRWSRRLPPA